VSAPFNGRVARRRYSHSENTSTPKKWNNGHCNDADEEVNFIANYSEQISIQVSIAHRKKNACPVIPVQELSSYAR
jgi:hypothetical protein